LHPPKKLRRGTPKNGCSFDPKAKKEETAAVGKTQRREGFFYLASGEKSLRWFYWFSIVHLVCIDV